MDKIILSEDRYGQKFNHFENDDLIDRLNNRYTVMVLILAIFVVTANLYVGNPINCWTPAQFTSTHNAYTNSICWLKGSYYLPTDEITIPDRSKPRTYFVSFYQWTPFILLGMALLFYFPRILWHALTRQGGLDVQRLVKAIKEKNDNDEGVNHAIRAFMNFLDMRAKTRGLLCCDFLCRNFGSGITVMYFFIKILYVINVVVQFILLNAFLAFQFTSYGFEALGKLFSGADWFESPRFPRVTMCDFMIRHLGSNQHWYAIQCNLPINMYNEKIFFGIWVWLIILMVLNILSIVLWIVSLSHARRKGAINKYLSNRKPTQLEQQPLRSATTSESPGAHQSVDFINGFTNYLKLDGFLTFQLVAQNTDDIIASTIMESLYNHYLINERPTESHV